ncbi:MAG: hypothetical protein ACYDC1_16500 [Limisphaerales bacterium]
MIRPVAHRPPGPAGSWLAILVAGVASATAAPSWAATEPGLPTTPAMRWADSSRLGRPFAKDPSVIRFGGRYLVCAGGYNNDPQQIGVATSRDGLR